MSVQYDTFVDLKDFNTFGVSVQAEYYVALNKASDWLAILETPVLESMPRMVLGGGSNILFTRGVKGLLLHNRIDGLEVVRETGTHIWLRVGGGVNWHDLVTYCVARDWGGIENLSLIPGTVGASPIQNIGAYGVELEQVFEAATTLDLRTGEGRQFIHQDCQFGYRNSVFKNEWKGKLIITHVTLRLTKKQHVLHTEYGAIQQELESKGISNPSIRDISEAVINIRQSKLPDPAKIGNCGSFFKNPEIPEGDFNRLKQRCPNVPGYPTKQGLVKVPAGWLIEQCGWKGKKVGNVGAYEKQALVLVNHGGATGAEAWQLAQKIKGSVEDKFGINIVPEVNIY